MSVINTNNEKCFFLPALCNHTMKNSFLSYEKTMEKDLSSVSELSIFLLILECRAIKIRSN